MPSTERFHPPPRTTWTSTLGSTTCGSVTVSTGYDENVSSHHSHTLPARSYSSPVGHVLLPFGCDFTADVPPPPHPELPPGETSTPITKSACSQVGCSSPQGHLRPSPPVAAHSHCASVGKSLPCA